MISDGLLDTSNYPSSHPLFSNDRKAKLGCVKDECAGSILKECIFLRPKLYFYIFTNQLEHKKAKGVQKSIVESKIKHSDYLQVYKTGMAFNQEVRSFQSNLHQISTVTTNKCALSINDDKRAWVSKNKSYAYGHYQLAVKNLTIFYIILYFIIF